MTGNLFTETIELPGFGLLAEGKPLAIDQLAAETGVEVGRLKELLVSVRSGFDGEGRLVDLFGMTLEPTAHRLEIGSNVVFSCCALWAHAIPKLINRSVVVRSVDPVSGCRRCVLSPCESLRDPGERGAVCSRITEPLRCDGRRTSRVECGLLSGHPLRTA